MHFHYDALMRTTIDLPETLHSVALGLARHTGRTLSQAVADLMQKGLDARSTQAARWFTAHYGQIALHGVQGHRQVTDTYLAALARNHGGKLVSFDRGLEALHADVMELVA
jgi:predicted nucleic acid-binding protein